MHWYCHLEKHYRIQPYNNISDFPHYPCLVFLSSSGNSNTCINIDIWALTFLVLKRDLYDYIAQDDANAQTMMVKMTLTFMSLWTILLSALLFNEITSVCQNWVYRNTIEGKWIMIIDTNRGHTNWGELCTVEIGRDGPCLLKNECIILENHEELSLKETALDFWRRKVCSILLALILKLSVFIFSYSW